MAFAECPGIPRSPILNSPSREVLGAPRPSLAGVLDRARGLSSPKWQRPRNTGTSSSANTSTSTSSSITIFRTNTSTVTSTTTSSLHGEWSATTVVAHGVRLTIFAKANRRRQETGVRRACPVVNSEAAPALAGMVIEVLQSPLTLSTCFSTTRCSNPISCQTSGLPNLRTVFVLSCFFLRILPDGVHGSETAILCREVLFVCLFTAVERLLLYLVGVGSASELCCSAKVLF